MNHKKKTCLKFIFLYDEIREVAISCIAQQSMICIYSSAYICKCTQSIINISNIVKPCSMASQQFNNYPTFLFYFAQLFYKKYRNICQMPELSKFS